MRYTWTFNGTDMSTMLITTEVTRDIGPNRTGTFQQVGVSNGRRFMRLTADMATIKVAATIIDDMPSKRRAIARALTTSEPAMLTFSDEPGLYYLAITDGQVSMSETYSYGEFDITFKVPDGVAHAIDTSVATGTSGAPITMSNTGTAPTAPILTATMTSENGLVAWTNDRGGALQFGSPDELDGVTKQKSERPLSVSYAAEPTGVIYNAAATNYPNYNGDVSRPNKQQGRIDYKVDYTGGQSAVPYFANGNTGDWGGPSVFLPIGVNSAGSKTDNFVFRTRFYFESSVTKQGRLEINLQNGDEVAYGFVIRDSSASEEQYKCELWIRDKVYAEFSLTKAQVGKGGYKQVTISKLGSVVQFEIGHVAQAQSGTANGLDRSVIKSFTLDNISDLPVDGYSAWFERYRDKEHVLMALNNTRFDWVNVDYWKDLPNRFAAGDVVTADVGQKRVYVNGIEDATLQTVGDQWESFLLPAGETIIQPVASEWADPFQAKVEYREAWY
ncbi:distal tail protein Dit [Lacticaseibacillus absianus]|uniref:distal tail protein Dit n=1 Tax=Lacticaseibacillus absianus TaxID=2729623 RepID=UPI0015C786A5|nr:distal tail protein Dit [Lacticaseibacillus absianus]